MSHGGMAEMMMSEWKINHHELRNYALKTGRKSSGLKRRRFQSPWTEISVR